MKMKMACPVHTNNVLFEKDLNRVEFFVFGKTYFCKLCQKSYFEEQCVPQQFGTPGGDDDKDEG